MKNEELITQLCEVIKEGELNASAIYDDLENINDKINSLKILHHEKDYIRNLISNSFALLQHQDLHRQKIERVVNYVCEHNNIDKTQYNLANSAKYIYNDTNTSNILSQEEMDKIINDLS